MKNFTTTTNKIIPELTIKDLKKMTDMLLKEEEKELPRGLGWFTKIMAKFGWHRKYEVLIFDKSKFNLYPFFNNKPPQPKL